MTPVSSAARTRPTTRLTKDPDAMIAPARPTLCWRTTGPEACSGGPSALADGSPGGGGGGSVLMGSVRGGGESGVPGEPLPGHAGDPALVGEGEVAVGVAQG